MHITVNKESPVPLYHQIREQIKGQILDGSLPSGTKLPPERQLASQLAVNRSTVLAAYQDLKAEGYIHAAVGKGTMVSSVRASNPKTVKGIPNPLPWQQLLNQNMKQFKSNLVQHLIQRSTQSDHISFAVGKPAAECLPLKEMKDIHDDMMTRLGGEIFQHCPTEGSYSFRETIKDLMTSRGINSSEDDIIVVSGAQQGHDLIARVFLEPGDVVFMEDPSYFSAKHIFQLYGANIISIPADANQQIQMDVLEALLIRYRPKFIYLLPTFQNPTGRVLSSNNRKKILDLAYRYQTFILEEDPYYELRYEGEPVPPIKALDYYGHVIYLGSFSKLLSPGLRVGWISAPSAAAASFVKMKQMMDLHSTHYSQIFIDQFYRNGLWSPHIQKTISLYRQKRDLMIELIQSAAASFPVQLERPEGGYFLWVQLPGHVQTTELLIQATALGVSFVPGNHFFSDEHPDQFIRLNFTFASFSEIEEGMNKLMQAYEKVGKANLIQHVHHEKSNSPLV